MLKKLLLLTLLVLLKIASVSAEEPLQTYETEDVDQDSLSNAEWKKKIIELLQQSPTEIKRNAEIGDGSFAFRRDLLKAQSQEKIIELLQVHATELASAISFASRFNETNFFAVLATNLKHIDNALHQEIIKNFVSCAMHTCDNPYQDERNKFFALVGLDLFEDKKTKKISKVKEALLSLIAHGYFKELITYTLDTFQKKFYYYNRYSKYAIMNYLYCFLDDESDRTIVDIECNLDQNDECLIRAKSMGNSSWTRKDWQHLLSMVGINLNLKLQSIKLKTLCSLNFDKKTIIKSMIVFMITHMHDIELAEILNNEQDFAKWIEGMLFRTTVFVHDAKASDALELLLPTTPYLFLSGARLSTGFPTPIATIFTATTNLFDYQDSKPLLARWIEVVIQRGELEELLEQTLNQYNSLTNISAIQASNIKIYLELLSGDVVYNGDRTFWKDIAYTTSTTYRSIKNSIKQCLGNTDMVNIKEIVKTVHQKIDAI